MSERILFLTGKLAEKQLRRILESMNPDFDYHVRQIGISVAALMSESLIRRRVDDLGGADRVLLPGRFRGDTDSLSAHYQAPFERGPEDLIDLPGYFGMGPQAADLSRHDCLIFAEIVDAPRLSVDQILERASGMVADGADVIDLGCLPDVSFPHLEDAVQALRSAGHRVSVDSALDAELLRGGRAGADYLLSLHEGNLHIAEEVEAIPVLIPAQPGDMDSLFRVIDCVRESGRPFYADPILDPIHYGFADSLMRYHQLRGRLPDVDILMGVGNLTELTDADSTGVNALLFGLISELRITAALVVQVSPHCRRAVAEADRARRLFYYAHCQQRLPVGIDGGLMGLRDRRPYTYTSRELSELAAMIRDPNFRIAVAEDGVHVMNRDGHQIGDDPFGLYPQLGLEEDAGHAFYMGVELARAEIAWRLGKKYNQDNPLNWGVAAATAGKDPTCFDAPGPTRSKKKNTRQSGGQPKPSLGPNPEP